MVICVTTTLLVVALHDPEVTTHLYVPPLPVAYAGVVMGRATLLRYHWYVYPVPVVALKVRDVPAHTLPVPAGVREALRVPMVTAVDEEVVLQPLLFATITE